MCVCVCVCVCVCAARVSLFGVETTILAREGEEHFYLCLHMISNGPLLQDVFFGIIGENRTAIGNSSLYQLFIVFCFSQYKANSLNLRYTQLYGRYADKIKITQVWYDIGLALANVSVL